ncbi:uncharacterized protein LOC135162345 [Diachasmimorpha longicaudata]|uniref:uncharacterized protein LOC135162345 n=1 Tax=Diachasmimorpha longicaudata TaxID=58733 RepID=UPI0030B86C19
MPGAAIDLTSLSGFIEESTCVKCICHCHGQRDRLTATEIFNIFGRRNDSEPVYGLIDIDLPKRHKRGAGGTKRICIPFSNGMKKCMNLKATESILANENTPVLFARSTQDGKVTYATDQTLQMLGKFTFYQDPVAKAAVVHFHRTNIIEGFLDYYYFQHDDRQLRQKRRATRYKLLPVNYTRPITKGIRRKGQKDHRIGKRGLRIDPVPEVVYPQILMQLERSDVRKDPLKALRQALAYWNAIDMLYSDLHQPRVQLNIAGFIVPQDDFCTPWVRKARFRDVTDYIDSSKALRALGKHFKENEAVFGRESFDYFFSFVGIALDATHRMLGVANVNVPCASRGAQVALLQNDLQNYVVGAHELGHLLSGDHDDETACKQMLGIMGAYVTGSPDNLKWSSCTKASFQKFFRNKASRCLDSCPKTKPNCGNQPSNFLDNMPDCLKSPARECEQRVGKAYSGHMTCKYGAVCIEKNKSPMNYCKIQPLPSGMKETCEMYNGFVAANSHLLAVQDGTICKSSKSNTLSACYRQKCVPVGTKIPMCNV